MAQEWINIDEAIDVVALAQGENPRIRAIALFDAIINNTDRKYGHILATTEGEIYGCDHGVTFHEDPKLRTVLWQFAGQSFQDAEISLLQRAQDIAPKALTGLITDLEVSALCKRIQELIEISQFPEPRADWPAVPWPPF